MKKVLVIILVAAMAPVAGAEFTISSVAGASAGSTVTFDISSTAGEPQRNFTVFIGVSDVAAGVTLAGTAQAGPAGAFADGTALHVQIVPGQWEAYPDNGELECLESIVSSHAGGEPFGAGVVLSFQVDIAAGTAAGVYDVIVLVQGAGVPYLVGTVTVGPEPDSLSLSSPNGGENLTAGTTYPIGWSSTGSISNVSLEYSDDNGAGWTVIEASTANNEQYDWTVPLIGSDECLIRIFDVDDPAVSDESDGPFTIDICGAYAYCFPEGHPDFDEWIAVGQAMGFECGGPACWCGSGRHCHGDADGLIQGLTYTGYEAVGTDDLAVLATAWGTFEPNPVTWGPTGPGIPADCLDVP